MSNIHADMHINMQASIADTYIKSTTNNREIPWRPFRSNPHRNSTIQPTRVNFIFSVI